MDKENGSSTLFNIITKLLIFLILAAVPFFITRYLMSKTEQPMAFNHKKHIVDNDKDLRYNCLQCHVEGYEEPGNAKENDDVVVLYTKYLSEWKKNTKDAALKEKRVITSPAMIIPKVGLCADCHGGMEYGKAKEKTEALKQIIDYSNKKKKIPWQRNYRLEPHIIFSHSRHIVYGKLHCSNCHGKISAMSKPVDRPILKTLDMFDGCLDCHEKKGLGKTGSDCLTCHKYTRRSF